MPPPGQGLLSSRQGLLLNLQGHFPTKRGWHFRLLSFVMPGQPAISAIFQPYLPENAAGSDASKMREKANERIEAKQAGTFTKDKGIIPKGIHKRS